MLQDHYRNVSVSQIQANVRCFLVRARYLRNRKRRAAIRIQQEYRGYRGEEEDVCYDHLKLFDENEVRKTRRKNRALQKEKNDEK